ncbi:hypothetical protein PGT21_001631 [Puccinia graminis f. sp. tritici]|uniref:Uncharacterized protein n=1 Tax=Puccinia graminis f. sp. tritici TaxID=56615 RepID=A0A5B0QAA0_PUCGR|nr:hypothetical protein PGT21_001631 [Puccinia graminis f. sp. tritici]
MVLRLVRPTWSLPNPNLRKKTTDSHPTRAQTRSLPTLATGPIYNSHTVGYFFIGFLITITSILNAFGTSLPRRISTVRAIQSLMAYSESLGIGRRSARARSEILDWSVYFFPLKPGCDSQKLTFLSDAYRTVPMSCARWELLAHFQGDLSSVSTLIAELPIAELPIAELQGRSKLIEN